MPGVRLTAAEKVAIAQALEMAGVHSIDAGFPAVGACEVDAIRAVAAALHKSVVTALCRTVRSDIDAAAQALEPAGPLKRGVSLFVGASPLHRKYKLHKSPAELLGLIGDTVSYAASRFEIVAFSPEDASRTEMDFLCQCYREAIDAGATTVGFPDTVGILTPEKSRDCLRHIQDHVPNIDRALLAVHFHNDLGLAVANSLACAAEGAHIIQGTIGGIGERAGNAALEEIVLALHLHHDQYGCRTGIALNRLHDLCLLVSGLTDVPIAPNQPVCGANIFATEAGIHQHGLLQHPETYLPYAAEMVGGPAMQLVIGKHSGRSGLAHRLHELGYHPANEELDELLRRIKEAPKTVDPDDSATLVRWLKGIQATDLGAVEPPMSVVDGAPLSKERSHS
jgi:2-isopropylmalate synthase